MTLSEHPRAADDAPRTLLSFADNGCGIADPRIILALEFSNTPGPRYKKQGPDSGEAFRDMLLEPAITEAETNGAPLTVDLDGSRYGYPVGWLEEVFGGLIRKHGRERFDRIHLTGSDHGSRQAIEEIRNLTDERTAGPANEDPETTPTRNNAQ